MERENSKDNSELTQILVELKNKGNFTGVILAKRNGELINENIEKPIDSKEFVSMCASVLEGANGLSETMRNQEVNKVITELNEESIVIVKVNKNSFLICILNEKSKSNLILEHLDNFIHKIGSLSP
ncbi:MAG: roadblock/LC7 domain-containing protein [Promethearchaeota archaeon]